MSSQSTMLLEWSKLFIKLVLVTYYLIIWTFFQFTVQVVISLNSRGHPQENLKFRDDHLLD